MAVSVGFIGLGNMGNPMAANVLKNGFPLRVYDKNAKAMENLMQSGAKAASSARDVVEQCEVVLTCVPGSPESEELYLSAGGVIDAAKAGNVLVDMSSVLPSTPRKLEQRAKARGVQFLEAPVSGGVTGARAATLAIMTGGDPAVLERVRPILQQVAREVEHVGPAGSGGVAKLLNNFVAIWNMIVLRLIAFGRCSRGTRFGISDWRAGPSNEVAAEPSAVSR